MSGIKWGDLFNWQQHKVEDTAIVVGGAAALTPQDHLTGALPSGQWLATHGIGVLTWIEIIQIIGALGVVMGLIKFSINIIAAVRKRSINELRE